MHASNGTIITAKGHHPAGLWLLCVGVRVAVVAVADAIYEELSYVQVRAESIVDRGYSMQVHAA